MEFELQEEGGEFLCVLIANVNTPDWIVSNERYGVSELNDLMKQELRAYFPFLSLLSFISWNPTQEDRTPTES